MNNMKDGLPKMIAKFTMSSIVNFIERMDQKILATVNFVGIDEAGIVYTGHKPDKNCFLNIDISRWDGINSSVLRSIVYDALADL